MEIKVLGSGCAKCKTTYEMIEKIVKENQLDATLSKVEDIVELLNYGIMTTPAIVVDGEVKLKGHVPTESEIKKILSI
ncbi:MAG: thioredoxin family protein [Butyricimonas faecihominis]|jgi:redox-active disulfide protein 2|nr:MAG: thioredoxin family protein [Butyricimonas synergistica]